MKLAIMQPYFFPYLGYFSLIRQTEKLVIFDNVQFIRHGWIERNRILKPNDGWQYISVPLIKHERNAKINEIRIRSLEDWKAKLLRQLEHYRKKARNYDLTLALIERSFALNTDSIVELDVWILRNICEYLEIKFNYEIFSSMVLNIEAPRHPGEWALNICKAMNATEYCNPPGGFDIFQASEFASSGIGLTFIKNNLRQYDQYRENFEAGLSIIDVLMFNDRNQILSMLDDIECIRAA